MSKAEAEATAAQIAAACYAVDGIENRFAAQSVANWFTTKGVNASEQTRSAQNSVFYEVYVPPLKSRAAANEEMRRMREDDFVDIMRINSGKLENGVAVGAYRQLGNAERRIKTFRAKGYQVEFKPRGETRSTYWFAVSAGTSGELRNQFSSTFPDYPLSESPCR